VVDEGYDTRIAGPLPSWFALYQPYQHAYAADPDPGYATRTAASYQPSYPPTHHAKSDDGYQTKTGSYAWLPVPLGDPHHHDPGGYATQNAFHAPYHADPGGYATQNAFHAPYRSAAGDGGSETELVDANYATKDLPLGPDDASDDEGGVVYEQVYANDEVEDDGDDDARLSNELPRKRPATPPPFAAAAAADYQHQADVVVST